MSKYPNLKSLKVFHKGRRVRIFLVILFTALTGCLTLAVPFAASQIIISITGGDYSALAKFAGVLFGLVVAAATAEMAADYFYASTTNALFLDARRRIAYKTMSMNLSSVYDKGSGFFLERLNEDSKEFSTVYLSIDKALVNLVINMSFIIYITALNYLLGLLFALGLGVLIFLEYLRVHQLLKNKKLSKRAVEKVKAKEAEILKGIKEIKGLNAREAVVEKHTEVSSVHVGLKYKREFFEKKMQRFIDILKGLIDFSVLLFAALYLLPKGEAELAAVLVVYTYKGNIYEFIAGLARIKDHYVNGELAAKRINDIIAAPADEIDNFGSELIGGSIKTIELENVVFGYSADRTVLNDVSIRIESPSLIGFVGRSGSGKSTIFSLLTGFYKASGGRILINGKDIYSLSEDAVRSAITPVLQDPYIFNDTVINNLLIAKADATAAQIEQACIAARIHDEILQMPDGYQTVIGENGATISGGQKQRLEIARALLKDTEVILFDEATSALDKNNQERINDLVIELGKTKIVLVIAHRFGIMRRCDKVVVLNEGKIVAADSHEELMKSCPYYAELARKNKPKEKE